MTNTKLKIVYTMAIAIELKNRGHKVIDIMPNPNKPNLNCWVFEEDETFIADLEEIVRLRRKE